MTRWTLILACLCLLSGCVGNRQGDEYDRAQSFSAKGYEDAMKQSGKSKELAEAKERERAHLAAQGGVQEEQR